MINLWNNWNAFLTKEKETVLREKIGIDPPGPPLVLDTCDVNFVCERLKQHLKNYKGQTCWIWRKLTFSSLSTHLKSFTFLEVDIFEIIYWQIKKCKNTACSMWKSVTIWRNMNNGLYFSPDTGTCLMLKTLLVRSFWKKCTVLLDIVKKGGLGGRGIPIQQFWGTFGIALFPSLPELKGGERVTILNILTISSVGIRIGGKIFFFVLQKISEK